MKSVKSFLVIFLCFLFVVMSWLSGAILSRKYTKKALTVKANVCCMAVKAQKVVQKYKKTVYPTLPRVDFFLIFVKIATNLIFFIANNGFLPLVFCGGRDAG